MNVPRDKDKEETCYPYCHAENGYRMKSGIVNTFKCVEENRRLYYE